MSKSPIWHPFTQHGLEEPIPLVERTEGAILHTNDGRRIIDAISSWWVNTHGHGNPRIMAAIAEQTKKLDQIIFAGWTHQPAEDLAKELRQIMPDTLTRVFFSDSGSTSVEVALKMALGYWHAQDERRHTIVVMEHSYHGDTIGAMSVGERGVFNQAYRELLFDVVTVPFPHVGQEQATFNALEKACANNAAAFIVEPLVLGAGGMLMYPPHVLAEMHRICTKHGVLFLADEVMTGWGRTGTLLACEQADITPDILCLSKGLTGGAIPLAVTMASEPIYQAHYSTDRACMFFHSSSYTANPIACAAAVANLAIWRDEPVADRIAALADMHEQAMTKLQNVPGISGVRRCGTILACEIGDGRSYMADIAPRLLAYFRERDMLVRPLGNTVYLMPPYCITPDDHAALVTAIADAPAALRII